MRRILLNSGRPVDYSLTVKQEVQVPIEVRDVAQASGSGATSTLTGSRARAGSRLWLRRSSSRGAHEERALPALRKLLELPFEHVIVSHGEPVHTRAAYERALEVTPWSG
jgi:hypothetical protein